MTIYVDTIFLKFVLNHPSPDFVTEPSNSKFDICGGHRERTEATNMRKKIICFFLTLVLCFGFTLNVTALEYNVQESSADENCQINSAKYLGMTDIPPKSEEILDLLLTPIQTDIFEKLIEGKSLSRKELVISLNIPRTTVYDNLLKLQKRKIVLKFVRNNGKRGRPIVYWYVPRHILIKLKKGKNNERKNL